MICDDCGETTDWKHAVQLDPWFRPTGDVFCENCAEKHWYRQQEKLMEDGGPDTSREDQHLRDAGRGHLVKP